MGEFKKHQIVLANKNNQNKNLKERILLTNLKQNRMPQNIKY